MKVAQLGIESSSALLPSDLYPFHLHSGPLMADRVISGQLSPMERLSWLSELIRFPLKNVNQQRVWLSWQQVPLAADVPSVKVHDLLCLNNNKNETGSPPFILYQNNCR